MSDHDDFDEIFRDFHRFVGPVSGSGAIDESAMADLPQLEDEGTEVDDELILGANDVTYLSSCTGPQAGGVFRLAGEEELEVRTREFTVRRALGVRVDPGRGEDKLPERRIQCEAEEEGLMTPMEGLNNSQNDGSVEEDSGLSNANARRLAAAMGFDQVFELVKRSAEESLGLHRAGLTLVLGDLTNEIGVYHGMGSNSIVMNRNIMKIVWRSLARGRRETPTST